jgi:hypothetical protein
MVMRMRRRMRKKDRKRKKIEIGLVQSEQLLPLSHPDIEQQPA